jgi:hypothetical protein
MRKILLASVATMGALLATAGGAKAQPLPAKIPAPGTIIIHFNGYLQASIGVFGSTFNKVTTAAGTDKANPVGMIGDFRMYPGFDAQTVSGIDYGAATDIRVGYSDGGVGQGGKSTYSTATTTVLTTKGGVTTATSTSTTTANGTDSLYVKRAYGYIGTPTYGYARFGQTDSAFTLLQDGVIEAFGDGGQWTLEGGEKDLLPSNAAPVSTIIYADQSAVYSTNKIVYITPAISDPLLGGAVAGIVGYEPNSNGLKEGYNNNTVVNSQSADLSSSNNAADTGKRRKNTFDGMVQYVWKGNGFVTKTSGGFIYGSPVDYDGIAVATGAAKYGYDDLEVYQLGSQVTYAGFTLGANIKGGQVLDGYSLKPKGSRDALTYMLSGNYVVGPYVIGASYFNAQSAGTYVPGAKEGRTLSEYGVAVGANYVIGKDLSLFTQYMYGHRHQIGNTTFVTNGNNSQVQVIALGATLKW